MKQLLLVRHAKSSWDNSGIKDFDRPLNQRGMADAALMGTQIKLRPTQVLCSSAERTRQTTDILLAEMGISLDLVEYRDSLYLASCQQLMQQIVHLPASEDCAMLISHNPSVAEFIETYTSICPARVPTCCVSELSYQVTSWTEVENNMPTTERFIFPAMFR